jgi:hypothetical protein
MVGTLKTIARQPKFPANKFQQEQQLSFVHLQSFDKGSEGVAGEGAGKGVTEKRGWG